MELLEVPGTTAGLEVVGNADATTMLLWLPALGTPARKYRRFAEALAAQGFLVAVLEWRGGESSSMRASRRCDWSYETLLHDIEASRAVLAERFPARCLLGGHSLGGQLAPFALAARPSAYAGLIFVAAGQPWWRAFPRMRAIGFAVGFLSAIGVSAAIGYFPGRRLGFGGRESRSVIRDWAMSGLRGEYRPKVPAALDHLALPVLAVRGVDDVLVSRSSFERLLAPLERCEITRVEIYTSQVAGLRADHYGWMREPSVVVDRASDWWSKTRPSPSTRRE
jgi:predicted alpha/beta hydrolase